MRILTGDECGLIKECIPEIGRLKHTVMEAGPSNQAFPVTLDGVQRVNEHQPASRQQGIITMAFTDSSTNKFASLRTDGVVDLWGGVDDAEPKNFQKFKIGSTIKSIFGEKSKETPSYVRPLGLASPRDETQRIYAADTVGNIVVMNTEKSSVVATHSAFSKSKQGAKLTYTRGQYENKNIASAMTLVPNLSQLAISGRERETVLIDLENGQQVWKGKNLAPDLQTLLQQPVWTTALTFLNESIMVAGTAYKQTRLYDIRQNSRRPIVFSPEGLFEQRIMCVEPISDTVIAVGDSAGYIYALDIRRMGRQRKLDKKRDGTALPRFVGPTGSIRQIRKHKTLDRIAVVGLDRMLRTYCTKTRRQLDCVYMKQRLNCTLFCSDDEWGAETTEEVDQDTMEVEDEVKDYVDSDDEDDIVAEFQFGKSKSGVESNGDESETRTDAQDEDDSDDDSNDEDDSDDEESSDEQSGDSDEEEKPSVAKKPRKK